MSGYEIAGIVLGSVPIVVAALQLYIDGASHLHRWRFYTRELKSLIRCLETEHAKLQNVCECLLRGIVDDDAQIDNMINDPFGPSWKNEGIAHKIKARLWRSTKVFEDNVLDMKEAMDEIKVKLNIGPDGQVCDIDSTGARKQLRRLAFVLRRADYHDLIVRLRNGVSSLESLLSSNIRLEKDRHHHSRRRWHNVAQNASRSIYQAIRSAVTCGCPGRHDIGLKLVPQSSNNTSTLEDEEVMNTLKFHIAVSYASTALETQGQTWGSVRLWNQAVLHPLPLDNKITSGIATRVEMAAPLSSSVQSGRTAPSLSQEGRFSTLPFRSRLSTNTATATTTTTTMTTEAIGGPIPMDCTPTLTVFPKHPEAIDSLCHSLRRSQKQGAGECCGYLVDQNNTAPRKFNLFPSSSLDDCDGWSMEPLGAILSTQFLGYLDRLRLARTVASSTLQLHNTPWLSTHNEIYLVRRGDGTLRQDAFVLRKLPETMSTAAYSTSKTSGPLGLGILLIELILGQTIDQLCPSSPSSANQSSSEGPSSATGHPGFIDDYPTLMRLLDRVNTYGGPNYQHAVRCCIKYDYAGAQDESDGPKEAYLEVLSSLERDFERGSQ